MKIIAWCYNCQQQISFNNVSEIEMVWQLRWMIMVIFTVANIKIESLDFKAKNVSGADRAFILIKIIGQFRENIFHWLGIWANDMIVTRHRIQRSESIAFPRINEKNVMWQRMCLAKTTESHITTSTNEYFTITNSHGGLLQTSVLL